MTEDFLLIGDYKLKVAWYIVLYECGKVWFGLVCVV